MKQQNKCSYYEEPRLANQRSEFLIRMEEPRRKKKVIYLDETWMHTHDSIACCWVEKDEVTGGTLGGVSRPRGKGK